MGGDEAGTERHWLWGVLLRLVIAFAVVAVVTGLVLLAALALLVVVALVVGGVLLVELGAAH